MARFDVYDFLYTEWSPSVARAVNNLERAEARLADAQAAVDHRAIGSDTTEIRRGHDNAEAARNAAARDVICAFVSASTVRDEVKLAAFSGVYREFGHDCEHVPATMVAGWLIAITTGTDYRVKSDWHGPLYYADGLTAWDSEYFDEAQRGRLRARVNHAVADLADRALGQRDVLKRQYPWAYDETGWHNAI